MKNIFLSLVCFTVFSANAMKDNDQKDVDSRIEAETDLLYRMDDEKEEALTIQNKIATLCQKNGNVEDYGELKVEYDPALKQKWVEFSYKKDDLQVLVTVLKNKNNDQVSATASCVRGLGYCTYRIPLEVSSPLVNILANKRAKNKSGHTVTFVARKK